MYAGSVSDNIRGGFGAVCRGRALLHQPKKKSPRRLVAVIRGQSKKKKDYSYIYSTKQTNKGQGPPKKGLKPIKNKCKGKRMFECKAGRQHSVVLPNVHGGALGERGKDRKNDEI